MKKRFEVVALHFTTKCNYNCPFCYKEQTDKMMDRNLFLRLPKYLKEITNQIALGGGEPFLFPELIGEFADECKRHGLICNVTTNGSKIKETPIEIIKKFKMISVSFDKAKIRNNTDMRNYFKNVKKIKNAGVEVGCNLLIDESMFNKMIFIRLVNLLMSYVNRVFVLYPKSSYSVDLRERRFYYTLMSMRHKHFYVDDLTNMVLNQGYSNWKKACHYGKKIVSINEEGYVTGCSFDRNEKAVMRIQKPKDVLKLKDIKFKERFECPYLVKLD